MALKMSEQVKVTGGKPFLPVTTKAGKKVDRDLGAADFGAVLQTAVKEKASVKFSAHALNRLQERNLVLNSQDMGKISVAIGKAKEKGVNSSLLLYRNMAMIVSIKNNTVITAMDKGSMQGQVFTGIDGAMVVE